MPQEATQTEPGRLIRIDDLTIDPVAQRVERGGVVIEIPELSFRLLHCLASAAPKGLSYQQLMDQVWSGRVVGEETVTQRVRLLRKALGDTTGTGQLIRTERGRGYRIAGQPRLEAMTDRESSRRKWHWAVLLLVLAVTGASIAIWSWPAGREPNNASDVGTMTEVDELLNRGWEYFNRHQADDTELAMSLFTQAFDRAPGDAQVMAAISMVHTQRATKFNGGPGEVDQALDWAHKATNADDNSAAARLALASALDASGAIGAAIAAYESTLELKPDHLGALSSVAYLYEVSGDLVRALEYNLRAGATGRRSRYHDLQVGKVLHQLGFAPAAESYFERAELLQPDNVFAPVVRADYLISRGRLAEARAVVDAAIERSVVRPELSIQRGMLALMEGNHEAARRFFEQALEVAPHSSEALNWLVVLRCMNGESQPDGLAKQLAEFDQEIESGDYWPSVALLKLDLHAACGDPDGADVAMSEVVSSGFRDVEALLMRPSLNAVRNTPAFARMIEAMRTDLAEQRQRVLSATWLPPDVIVPEPGARP